jgi:shikimate kinase
MNSERHEDNLVLIGMPGVGKSTVGVLLAKVASMGFVDTDVRIQSAERRCLQEILVAEGPDAFREIEEDHLLALDHRNTVIATGGSAVYCDAAMAHLRNTGSLIWLDLPLGALKARLTDLGSRGVVKWPHQSLDEVHAERRCLYHRWADFAVDCAGKTQEEIVEDILSLRDATRTPRVSGEA